MENGPRYPLEFGPLILWEKNRYLGDDLPTVQCALHRIFSIGRNFLFGKILR